MEHLPPPSLFNDVKMTRFCFALWGKGSALIVPFYAVQDCSLKITKTAIRYYLLLKK